ncbi:MAG: peptidase [Pseudomonadales bacterium]
MTYCLGISVAEGLVMISDSRTNAGVDQVDTYPKMWSFGQPGRSQYILCSAGNLATTQAVVTKLQRDVEHGQDNLYSYAHVDEVAGYIGRLSVAQRKSFDGAGFSSSFLLAGQSTGERPQLYLIYPEGNYIGPTEYSPFLQIGETKYGKPILDRVITPATPLERAALCGLISMDATMKSNLTVGPPIDVALYRADGLQPPKLLRFDAESEYLNRLRHAWNDAMSETLDKLPPLPV